jgi:hypothetical protein
MAPKYKGIPKIGEYLSDVDRLEDLPFSYIKFLELVSIEMKNRVYLRQGQVMSDVISKIAPDFGIEILADHKYDPYYDDKKITNFIIKCFESGILK